MGSTWGLRGSLLITQGDVGFRGLGVKSFGVGVFESMVPSLRLLKHLNNYAGMSMLWWSPLVESSTAVVWSSVDTAMVYCLAQAFRKNRESPVHNPTGAVPLSTQGWQIIMGRFYLQG